MSIDWSLAPKISGSDYLGPLHAMELGRQARASELTQKAREKALQQFSGGDAAGAVNTATTAGDFDLATHLNQAEDQHKQQIAGVYDTVLRTAYALKSLPPEQRQAAFDAQAPRLQAMGVPGEIIQQYRGQLDDRSLDAVAQQSMSVLDQIKQHYEQNKPVVLAQGSDLVNPATKEVLASNAPEAKWIPIPAGGSIAQVGPNGVTYSTPGGAAGAPGAAPGTGGPTRTNGFTPRQRDGGDNPDNVVDGKIAALSHALGVDPDQPLTPVQVAALAHAIPATEGGPNSIAARNNNPTNIKDGAFARSQPGYQGSEGGFAKFATPQAGQAAAQALLGRYYARGQQTIRDIIEGKPIGAAAPRANIINGPQKPQYTILGPQEKKAAGLDPSIQYQRSPDGQITAISGQPTQKTDMATEAAYRKEFDQLPEVKTFKIARQQFQALKALATKPNPTGQDDIALIFTYMKTLDPNSTVREGEFSTAQNSGSVPQNIMNAYNKALQGTRLSPAQRTGFVNAAAQNYIALRQQYNQAAENYRSYARDSGVKPDNVARTYTPDGQAKRSAAAPSHGWGKATVVK